MNSPIFSDELMAEAARLLATARTAGLRLVTAESCTGGLVAALLTEIAGSSDVVERGYVTYSNTAKTTAIGVPTELIETHGAVSREVAFAMAQGALAASEADISVAITGVAGPGGGSVEKPIGLVWFATARRGQLTKTTEARYGDLGRSQVRLAALRTALELIASQLA